jgi:dihydrofolate synthase/folylpolyglutamate synthase
VGLGGRLDCTNIITPLLSIITNISFDHVQFLGNTLEKIAQEKAGIIKPGVPVVIGETNGEVKVRDVFALTANNLHSEISFADELYHEPVESELKGDCQVRNTQTILTALDSLRKNYPDLKITDEAIREGFLHVCEKTGLMGRWQTISQKPLVICDTGHNVAGWEYLSRQLDRMPRPLHIIIGMVSDKDVTHVLKLMPHDAQYYFTQASVKRAMPVEQFAAIGKECGLTGNSYPDVATAYANALQNVGNGSIFVGGSTFIVSDLLSR